METDLTKYKDYQPSALDSKNNYISWDQEAEKNLADWLIAPVIKTRDADLLEQSNFDTALDLLGGESDNVQIHNFGHWACGHYDIILVKPDTDQAKIAQEIYERLQNYAILDETHFSELEHEQTLDNIKSELPIVSDIIPETDLETLLDQVYDWLSENDPEQLESRDFNGAYPETEAIEQAIADLGYYTQEQIEQEHRDKLLSNVYPEFADLCCCEACRLEQAKNQE